MFWSKDPPSFFPYQAHLHPSEDEEADRRKYSSYRHEDLVEEFLYVKSFVQKFEVVAIESKAEAKKVCVCVCVCVCHCATVFVIVLYCIVLYCIVLHCTVLCVVCSVSLYVLDLNVFFYFTDT